MRVVGSIENGNVVQENSEAIVDLESHRQEKRKSAHAQISFISGQIVREKESLVNFFRGLIQTGYAQKNRR
jgi:hypothetical protein